MTTETLKVVCLKGQEIFPYISALANLRVKIFREYPYLYVGDFDYEKNYLQTYTQCNESIMVIVSDKENVVGASTAVPLIFEVKEFQKPFIDHRINIEDIFYFGESILLPAYRGRNIYRRFFEAREAAARLYGSKMTAFCEVERAKDDPRRPKNYKPLDNVWQHFEYQKHPELCAYFPWQEIGETQMSVKPMIFWLKTL